MSPPHTAASGDAARAGSTESRATGAPMGGPPSGHGRGPGGGPISAAVTGDVMTTATPRGGYQVRPSYPASARRLGVHGTTLLRVFVSAAGRVTEVTIETSAGHPDLDRAAADAVRRWLFEPGLRGSEPIGMWVLLPVEFRLK
jgi:protein TonB